MNISITTSGLLLAAAGVLAGCGGGNSDTAKATHTPATNVHARGSEATAESFSVATTRLHSSDAFTPVIENASKTSADLNPVVKSVPVVSRNRSAPLKTVELGAVPAADLGKREANNRQSPAVATAKAYQTGIGRAITSTSQVKGFQQTLAWSELSSGHTAGMARFSSANAYGIRLGMLVADLPDNALVRVSSADADTALEVSGSAINKTIAANIAADGDSTSARTYWLPMTTGSIAELEIELPAGVASDSLAVSVPSLAHLLEATPQAAVKEVTLKSDCPNSTPDPVCNATLPPAANAVAAIDFVDGSNVYVCTGTLLADKPASGQPYFLTANHCIGNQTVASSMYSYWFWRASACNSTTANPNWTYTTGGATLLWTRSDSTSNTKNPVGTDTSFMKLNVAPPAGVMYAGWTNTRQAISPSVNLTGLHHPGGYLLRQSTGTISNMGVFTSSGNLISTGDTTQPMYQVSWSAGLTEGGSSGSGLFLNGTTSNPQLVGQLWGGYASCTAPNLPDFYGRFDLAYQDGLIDWLNPGYKMVFRFYNTNNGSHFFSANVAERDQVRSTIPSLLHEGPVFSVAPASKAGLSPVYRFYNRNTGVHFYTINENERLALMPNASFQFEGVAWYARQSADAATGTVPVYRFYKLNLGTHVYTVSVAERDNLINNAAATYAYEGVAYHAWAPN